MLSKKNRQNVSKDLVFLEIAILCVLTGRMRVINIWRLQFLMDVFENVNRQCKRTTLMRKGSQNAPRNKLCLIIANLLAQIG